MFVKKVLNWIVPLEESKSNEESELTVSEEVEIKHTEIPEADITLDSLKVSTSTFGTVTSLLNFNLEPDRNSADASVIAVENCFANSDVRSNYSENKMLTENSNLSQTGIRNEKYADMKEIHYPPSNSSSKSPQKESIILKGSGDGIVYSSGVSRLSPSSKKVLPSKVCTSSRKSCYTQTEIKKTRRRRSFKEIPSPERAVEFASDLVLRDYKRPTNVIPYLSPEDIRLSNIRTVPAPDTCVYGELFVLGCNGSVSDHLVGHMECRYVLRKRQKPNGVKEAFSFVTSGNHPFARTSDKHTVYYQLTPSRSVVVEYIRDKNTDMFQIGRFEKHPVDFRVLDVNGSGAARNGVSRFACRIVVHRFGNHEARVYAAAFDATGHIFLGEGALTCVREGKMDGFTTNGVLIMHPSNRVWREVSVCGYLYPLRSPNVETKKRPRLLDETNVLQDGTMIDLCGVTLVWRTPSGLRKTPSRSSLKRIELELLHWPPDYEIPLKPYQDCKDRTSHAFLFLSCGHVMGLFGCGQSLEGWTCPICHCIGPVVKLRIGMEPGFYVDSDFLTHAFRPCGHATTLKTVQYWSTVKVPEHRSIQEGFCPFCGMKLNSISKYIELKYPQ